MIYLNNFNQHINEEMSWKNFLLVTGLLYGAYKGGNEIRNINTIRKIYSEVNSNESNPVGKQKEICERIRHSLISQIKKSDKFNRFGKQPIIDSLVNIKFKIVDSTSILIQRDDDNETVAALFTIGVYKRRFAYLNTILSVPKEEDMIIISRSSLDNPNLDNVIYHELYHYIDKLLGDITDKINFDPYLDKKILTDKSYAENKFMSLVAISLKGKESKGLLKLLYDVNKLEVTNKDKQPFIDLADEWISNYNKKYIYLTSKKEIYARWYAMKQDMLLHGVIKSIDQEIRLDDVGLYLTVYKNRDLNYITIDLLMSLDLSKVDKLQIVI